MLYVDFWIIHYYYYIFSNLISNLIINFNYKITIPHGFSMSSFFNFFNNVFLSVVCQNCCFSFFFPILADWVTNFDFGKGCKWAVIVYICWNIRWRQNFWLRSRCPWFASTGVIELFINVHSNQISETSSVAHSGYGRSVTSDVAYSK